MTEKHRPIICFDFDGVIHAYTRGWHGPRTIADPPVPGALEYLVEVMKHFEVCIFSSRSNYVGGRLAMKRWLIQEYTNLAPDYESTPQWLRNVIAETAFADPWEDEVRWAIKRLVERIKFPNSKPPAMVTIDDRAVTFTGRWPTIEELKAFEPWYKREQQVTGS